MVQGNTGSRSMVQGMKRQNGISKMKSINMGDDKKEKIMIVHGEPLIMNRNCYDSRRTVD